MNQFAFLKKTLGCKEALIVDEIIMAKHPHIHTLWLDVKKAFDSVIHPYLFRRLQSLAIPKVITSFIEMHTRRPIPLSKYSMGDASRTS